MTKGAQSKPRIVIYGTGQFGMYVARLALSKGWTIVAAYNRAGAKTGQDVGRLAGLGRDVGVIVQDCEAADYSGLDADIGVVTMTNMLQENMPAYRRLLSAGLNVICHGGQSYYPQANDPALAAEIDELAKAKGVTFTGSGIWDMSRIWSGILVAGPCTDIKSLLHTSITDVTRQAGNMDKAAELGIGLTIEEFEARDFGRNPLPLSYIILLEQVLTALGYTTAGRAGAVEPVVFDVPLDIPAMGRIVPAGECVGLRIVGRVETREGVSARCEIELRLFKEGEVEHMFWSVDGMPGTRVRVERDNSAHATAACLFNRIPDVIAAPPGIVLVSQMGPLKSSAAAQGSAT